MKFIIEYKIEKNHFFNKIQIFLDLLQTEII
jgi:hypothetical protein